MIDPRVASGLRDILPAAMIPRERALATFRETFADFGFVPIETPHIERMEVLTGKGAGSDEVLRQIYSVTNKGGEPGELALRFDLTVPFARFVAKHINELGRPFKRYAIGSVFRGERPAKGRFREFVQCDFDAVGTESPLADAETAQVIHAALSAIGVPAFTISLNNRKILDGFIETLDLADEATPNGGIVSKQFKISHVMRSIDKREKLGPQEFYAELMTKYEWGWEYSHEQKTNISSPVRVSKDRLKQGYGFSILSDIQALKVEGLIDNGVGGPEILKLAEVEFGTNPRAMEGIENLRKILDFLDSGRLSPDKICINLGLARGLDYYTGVVYETKIDGAEEFGSVASGGRYDNLTRLFTNQVLPGVGASIGLDRLFAVLEDKHDWGKGASATVPVLFPNFPGSDPRHVVGLASRLRAAGIGAEVYPDAIQAGKQLQYGSSRGHKLAVIVGPAEQESMTFNLRDLSTREERKGVPWADLESVVAQALGPDKGAGR